MVIFATVAILAIGSTSTTKVHAQVDCSANPDDPSCQSSSDNNNNNPSSSNDQQQQQQPQQGSGNHALCVIILGGIPVVLGHPELSPVGIAACG